MIRLNLAQGPKWIDLAHGVRVEVLPLATEARIRASRDLLGPEGEMEGDGAKRDVAYVKSIARSVIIAWDEVFDEGGAPMPVTPEAVDALLDVPDIYHTFHARYVLPGLVAVQEGNGSAPSPGGTSATATNTAVPAKPRARHARAASTRPKRSKAT